MVGIWLIYGEYMVNIWWIYGFWVSIDGGSPKAGWFKTENPSLMIFFPLFWETTGPLFCHGNFWWGEPWQPSEVSVYLLYFTTNHTGVNGCKWDHGNIMRRARYSWGINQQTGGKIDNNAMKVDLGCSSLCENFTTDREPCTYPYPIFIHMI